jgi:ATP-dependent helicase HrpA
MSGTYRGWAMSSQSAAPASPSVADLAAQLDEVMIGDAHRFRRRLDGVGGIREARRRASTLHRLEREIATARLRLLERQAAAPVVRYPPELPVAKARDELLATIRDNQVVIVAGETGSGKTTQLPKICLELGRGLRGTIGHTQPRRIAARTVAERIAEELDTDLGGAVGYTVRFTDEVGPTTLVKLMTDGILLAEIQRDRLLTRYDTIIIDEAHERSLNIDFLLGYLKELLPRRPDLKVVVTSATIDPERFSRHFDDAPIVEVSGRMYPVEIRYRPLDEGAQDTTDADGNDADDDSSEPRDQIQGVGDAVEELATDGDGDILVFLSGEREIRDTAEALRARIQASRLLRGTEVLPLYARLSAAEQHRVFHAHTERRIVLATNVAETSLTVPGIHYVVDPGTARISRYSYRTKVQRLPIEPISQASANQRAGRSGRVADGICVRMYSEADFESRPEFTDPEILRTNLASVILQMSALGLGDVEAFPFVDPPDRRSVRDGLDLLHELGALDLAQSDPRRRLTPLGRRLAQLPIDPRLGRMVLEADRLGCVREVMVIAAALSIQDPRERPSEHQQAADALHARFADPTSDFLGWLQLWTYIHDKARELSSSAFRRMCKREFLNYLRIREWQDLVAQLRQLARSVDVTLNADPVEDPVRIHTALLAGLLSHVGVKDSALNERKANDRRDRNEYLGARGARFAIFPGSALFAKPPTWVMAAELVETSRLYARECARIEPEWVEPLAHHLVKRSYSEPHWEARRGSVVATERVTLYGVPIVSARTVQYGRIDPELARELFIRHALVEGDWRTHHRFLAQNRELLEDVEDLENRARRRDILVDDETLFAFYHARIPASVVSAAHFDSWWKRTRRENPDLLTLTLDVVVAESRTSVDPADYPDTWRQGDLELKLRYAFEPGSPTDGVTVEIPIAVLNQADADDFAWQVPGLRLELVTELIRTLPKQLRRLLVPAPDHAREALAQLRPREEPLLDALERELGRQAGAPIPRDAWQLDRLPGYLRLTLRVLDGKGQMLAEGKDLDALRRRLRPRQRESLAQAASGLERGGLRTWPDHLPDGALPRTFTRRLGGQTLAGFPALVDEGSPDRPAVAVRVMPTETDQERAMALGTRRLLLLNAASPARAVLGRLDNQAKLALASAPHPSPSALFDDVMAAAVDAIVEDAGGPAWTAGAFDQLLATVRERIEAEVTRVITLVARVLSVAGDVDRRLRGTTSLLLLPALTDVRTQISHLVFPGFVAATGVARLPDVVRYLRAAVVRLDALPEHPERDRQLMWRIELVQQSYDAALAAIPPGRAPGPELAQVRWMIEELRVSFFAQQLGTAYPVSEKRIQRVLAEHPT